MNLVGPINSGLATGGAGLAGANADSPTRIIGRILGVYVKYNDAPPAATTDVVIKTKGLSPSPPSDTILTLTNGATDGWRYPRHVTHDEAGVIITYNGTQEVHEPVLVHDQINVSISEANDGDNVDVWLLVDSGGY